MRQAGAVICSVQALTRTAAAARLTDAQVDQIADASVPTNLTLTGVIAVDAARSARGVVLTQGLIARVDRLTLSVRVGVGALADEVSAVLRQQTGAVIEARRRIASRY